MASRDHYEKFEAFAQRIGVPALKRVLPMAVRDPDNVVALVEADHALNNVSLSLWDMHHPSVHMLATNAGLTPWPMSYTVCILKHVAKYHVANVEPPEVAA